MTGPPSAPDHRQVLAAIPAEQRQALTARRDGPALRRATLHIGAIIGLGALIALRIPGWPLLMLPQGILIVFLFTAMHEATHDTAFARTSLNRLLARLAGVLLILPPRYFRAYHFAHHRHTQDAELDPELQSPKPATLPGYLWYLSGLPTWRDTLTTLLHTARGQTLAPFIPNRQRTAVVAEARRMVALYALALILSLAAQSPVLVMVWIVPAVLGQPFLRAFLLAEHGLCPPVANMLENTRTTFTHRALRWLSWNMSFHAEHHSLPTVPFHQLPALHRIMAQHLRVTSPGYARFHSTYAASLTAEQRGTSVG